MRVSLTLGRRIAALVTASFAWPACARPPPEPLDLRVTGCVRMRAGPVCEVGEGPLRVWSEHAGVRVAADRGEPRVVSEERGAGWLHRVAPPSGAGRLDFVVEDGAIRRARSLTLAAAEPEPRAVLDARARRRAGELDAAVRAAEVVRRSGSARERVWAGAELGRALLATGRMDEAADVLAASAREHAEAGDLSESVRDTMPRVMALRLHHRLPEARAVLASIPASSMVDAASVAEARYFEGMLDVSAGAAARALGAFADAERRYVDLGMPLEARMVGQQRAMALLALGRPADAASALAGHAAVLPGERGCDRVDVLAHEAWAALLSGELDAEAAPDASSRAASALDQALDVPCADPRRQAELRLDRARVALLAGDADEAARHLAAARAAHERPDATLSADARVVSARVALARGDTASAASAADELVRLQEASGDADALAQALELRSRARLRAGALPQAREDAARAEELVDALARTVALGEGAAAFFSGHARVTAARISVELAAGDPAAALSASRRARRRLLARSDRVARLAALPPEARAAWEIALGAFRRERDALAEDAARDADRSVAALEAAAALRRLRSKEALAALDRAAETLLGPPPAGLATPAPGEVWLSAVVTPERAFAFAHSTSGVRAIELPIAPARAISSLVVTAFRDELAAARRIVVVASGGLGAVDWHALPLSVSEDERPLLAVAPVEYAKDLAPTPEGDGVRAPAGPPVVIGDPTGDLPSAAREVSAVAAALASFSPVVVRGRDADRARTIAALGSASFLHYAGHGVFAGRDGEESRLPLAGGALSVPDILALPRVPSVIVLSGCDTARAAGAETAEAHGLASAFLAAGAQRVVAASRSVDDALAERFMRELHAGIGSGAAPLPDPAMAARRAALAVRAELPGADWAAFRVLRR